MPKKPKTICNPMNLSYRYQRDYRSRESADPAVAVYKGEYYLFASHGSGYWVSDNLSDWEFIEVDIKKFPEFEKFAPAPLVIGDTMYLTHSNGGDILKSDTPRDPESWIDIGKPYSWGDPAFFADDDGYVYMYEGCSDKEPIRVLKLDPNNNMSIVEGPADCIFDRSDIHGLEVPGDENELRNTSPWIEGAWMNKIGGKYYLTYAAPGTQFATYADGCYVSDSPMGPFTYCDNSPVIFKATGFMRGCGHGCLFEDLMGRLWKIDTVAISVNHMFERRIALFPAKMINGRLYTNTLRSDYPMYLPSENPNPFENPTPDWQLISLNKKVRASSVLDDGHKPEYAADENLRTWWSAKTSDASEWIEVDLGDIYTARAVQINFADQDCIPYGGRDNDFCCKYLLEVSSDGESYRILADRRDNAADMPHDYIELEESTEFRYIRLTNCGKIPCGGKFAVSGIRVFGDGKTEAPAAPKFKAIRLEDEREMRVEWEKVPGAQGYYVRFGISPDELYTHYQVIGSESAHVMCLNAGVRYHVTVDSYNEGGITPGTEIESV